ncbi:YncE family protein [Labrenzia aggregata]|uniref:YncE family protein n=1 Tax=Roseibium aggregatum TaxID=187304 RepID=A0A926NXD3_9HYPH|nr:YncE family protein [Roseibium aggregatum]
MPFTRVFRRSKQLLFCCFLLTSPAGGPALAGSFAFVTNQNSSDVSVLDLENRKEIQRIPVAGKPAGIAVSARLNAFYTVSPDSKTVRRFSLSTCKVIASAELPGGPMAVAAAPQSGLVFVSDWYNARIFVLDAEELTLTGELKTGGAPAEMIVAEDGSWLASADRDSNQVSIFDLPDMTLRARIAVGERPFGIGVDPQGRIHAANVGSDSVSVIDPETKSVIATVPVGARPYGVAFANGRAFTTDQYADTVSVYRLSDFAPEDTLDVGEYPEGIDATPDGRLVVSTNWFSNTVSLIDPETLEVVGEIETGDGPRADGKFIHETSGGDVPCAKN